MNAKKKTKRTIPARGPTWAQVCLAKDVLSQRNHSNQMPKQLEALCHEMITHALTTSGWAPKR